jgi:hypothetical protein
VVTTKFVAVGPRQIFGAPDGPEEAPGESTASRRVDTSFVERHDGTDLGRDAKRARKTDRFGKDRQVHGATTYLTRSSDNFCWCARILRVKDEEERRRERSPAPAAGLTDHVRTWEKWLGRPAVQSS